MNVPKMEREIGIEVYCTQSRGIGGRLRQFPEDFKVEEILINGSKALIEPSIPPKVSGRGRYLICALVKRNIDTFLAVRAVANKLGISQERIQIAGIKDARALTAQHVSIGRMLPEELKRFELDSIRVYPMAFSNEKLSSRLIHGNQFRITVRGIYHLSSKMLQRISCLHEEVVKLGGCPNFFGHQRFGTVRSVTHLVGKHILRDQWQEAALTFLAKPSPYEHPESRRARELLWNSQNYSDAFRSFPFKLVYERDMLQHLARQPNDFRRAFSSLPKKLLQLFIQAYQSYLFNRFLSQRIKNGLPLKNAQKGEYKLEINEDQWLALPLIGFGQPPSAGEQGEIERQILESEGVAPQDFTILHKRELSAFGGLRTALTPLVDFSTDDPCRDVANPRGKSVALAFTLRRGSYATVVLREFMKVRDPVKAGF